MKSDEIAKAFYDQGLSNKWLSKKQASWLWKQACYEAGIQIRTHGTPTASGIFALDTGEMIGWEIAISPKNGCAPFKTHSVTELHERAMMEEARKMQEGKEFCKIAKGTQFENMYTKEDVARIFKVSLETAQEWMGEAGL